MELKDEEILLRLSRDEDHFLEKKTQGDHKDWLKTVVAFANSAPYEYPAILCIGVKNDGTIEDDLNLDQIQKKFNEKVKNAFPTIYYLPKIISKDGKNFLACIVPGSRLRPHFAGQAYVRKGSETFGASEQEFNSLIAQRIGKAHEIQKWIDRKITVDWINKAADQVRVSGRVSHSWEATVESCNQHYVTLKHDSNSLDSLALEDVRLSYDHKKDRLKLDLDWCV